MKKDSRNLSAVPDLPADDPVGTMDRFTDGLKRVLASPKIDIHKKTTTRKARKRKH